MKEIRIENIEDMSMSDIHDRFNTEMVYLKTWRCAKCKYCTVNGRAQGCDCCTKATDVIEELKEENKHLYKQIRNLKIVQTSFRSFVLSAYSSIINSKDD